jgi:hypothetical protein
VPPAEFDALKAEALALGFPHVESGPMVRSSYHADGQRDIVRELAARSTSGPPRGPAPPATGSGEQSSPSPTRIAVAPSGGRDP